MKISNVMAAIALLAAALVPAAAQAQTWNAEGKNETTHGRCSDTLVRDGGKWVFLGWSCSDEPKPR